MIFLTMITKHFSLFEYKTDIAQTVLVRLQEMNGMFTGLSDSILTYSYFFQFFSY